jgi:hypothetical protein
MPAVRTLLSYRVWLAAIALLGALALPARAGAQAIATADAFTRLFGSMSPSGWLGGDGTASVGLPDGRVAWLFSDTITGATATGGVSWVHNSLVITGPARKPRVIPQPLPSRPDGSYFWLEAGRLNASRVWVLAMHMVNTGAGLFDFRCNETWLAKINISNWTLASLRALPNTQTKLGTTWGAGLFDYGGYTYIYGIEGTGSGLASVSYLHVARVPLGRLDRPWWFYTGHGWSHNPTASARVHVSGPGSSLSEALSLINRGNRGVRLISQQSMFGSQIYSWRSPGPVGPFTRQKLIYDTQRLWNTAHWKNTYTYNALAHPEQAGDGTILFSFNVNVFANINAKLSPIYRPRFFRVALNTV